MIPQNTINKTTRFVLVISAILSLTAQASEVLDFTQMPASGMHILKDFKGQPGGGTGRVAEISIKLPAFTKATYFTQDVGSWPYGTNRTFPWASSDNLKDIFNRDLTYNPSTKPVPPQVRGMTAIFKLASGDYLTLLPFGNEKTISSLRVHPRTGELFLEAHTFGKAEVSGDLPVMSWGRDKNLYRSVHLAWKHAIESAGGRTDWRKNKHYPEPFKYLGWCSWAQYYKKINSDLLVDTAKGIEESGVPVRWFLVDDGFHTEEGLMMKSFKPSSETFPNGWEPLLAQRKEDKIKWFGLWHCHTGLWRGIHKDNDFGKELNDTLLPVTGSDALVPGKSEAGADLFYDAYVKSVKDYGFDFLKMDNQSQYIKFVLGQDNPVTMNNWTQQALEKACKKYMNGLLNCMAHSPANHFNTRYSATNRVSTDYKVGVNVRAKSALMQAFGNSLWLGQTVWTDHDMFHSSDKVNGRMMAIAKALSGGPVYLSDAPEDFIKDYISPLIYEDGEVLRPLAPAVPLPESAFMNVFSTPEAYRVVAPLANKSAAIAVYNLMHPKRRQKMPETTLVAEITPADYPHAAGMIQPATEPWEVPKEGLVVYDWYKGKGEALKDSYKVELKGFSDGLVQLSPVENGWAVIGAANRYLSAAAVSSSMVDYSYEGGDLVEIEMVESSPLVVYSKTGKVMSDDYEVTDLGNGFWRVELPVGERGARVTVSR